MSKRPDCRLLAAVAVTAAAACGDGTIEPPDDPPAPASLQLIASTAPVAPGATVAVEILVRDERAQALAGAAVDLEVVAGNGTVSPGSMRTDAAGRAGASWKIGPQAGVHRLRASSGPVSAEASVTAVRPSVDPVLTELRIGDLPAVVRTGERLDVDVLALDQDGAPMTGVTIAATVLLGGGTVPTDPLTTGTTGRVSLAWTVGTDAGEQRLRVHSGDRSAEASVVAEKPTLGGFGEVSGSGQEGPLSRELDDPVVVQVVDTDGLPYPGLPLAWRVVSGGGTVAPDGGGTDADGRQSARWTLGPAVGEQRLEIVADDGLGSRAGLIVTATAFEGIRITTTLPPMRSGRVVDVVLSARGGAEETGYSWTVAAGALPPGVALSVDGVLGGTPAADGLFPFTLRAIDADGIAGERDYEVRVCEGALQLAVGEADVRTYPGECPALLPADAGGVYRVGVMARGRDHGQISPVAGGLRLVTRLEGSTAAAAAVAAGQGPATADGQAPAVVVGDHDAGWLHRESLSAAARAPRPTVRPVGSASSLRAAAAVAPPAGRLDFLVFSPEGEIVPVGATLRAYSTTVAYYEDDGVLADGGTVYDQAVIGSALAWHDAHTEPVLREAFGGYGPPGTVRVFTDDAGVIQDRLIGDLDGNGRLIALQLRPTFLRGAQGFATGCDQMPRPEHAAPGAASCVASNEAEVIYVRGPGKYLLAHEAKHVTSVAWTLYGGRAAHHGWIEEGTAVLASELASRHASGVPATHRVGPADVYVGGQRPPTDADSYLMWAAVVTARRYLAAAPHAGITGDPDPNPGGSSFYTASWLFHRFVMDAYGGGDPHGLMRRLNTVSGGVAGLEAETGRTMSQLFTELMRAVLVEDIPEARQATARRFQSYAFADVLAADPSATLEWPPFVGTGSFATASWDLPTWETASNLFELDAAGGVPLEVEVLHGDGAPVGPEQDVALLIVRVR